MRSLGLNVFAVLLLTLGVFAGVDVQAMDGYGSPWGFQDCNSSTGCTPSSQTGAVPSGNSPPGTGGGHPFALIRPAGYNGPGRGLDGPCVPLSAAGSPTCQTACVANSSDATCETLCAPINGDVGQSCPGPFWSIYYGGGPGNIYGGSNTAYNNNVPTPANWPPQANSFYWDRNKMCMLSPQCIPYPMNMDDVAPGNVQNPSFRISNPFHNMGPPSQPDVRLPSGQQNNLKYRTFNPCTPIGATPYSVGFGPVGAAVPGTQNDNSPIDIEWNQIESIMNEHVHDDTRWAKVNSIVRTPFDQTATAPANSPPSGSMPPPPGGTLGSNTYAYSSPFNNQPYVFGNGRFHTENEHIYAGVAGTTNQDPNQGLNNTALESNGNPEGATGPADSNFTVLGNDGYLLGEFQTPVMDHEGFDFSVNTLHDSGDRLFTTMCVLGATNPQGPFTLVHSSFVNDQTCDVTRQTTSYCPMRNIVPDAVCREYPTLQGYPNPDDDCAAQLNACPSPPNAQGIMEYCWHFDLRFFYTPLRRLCGVPCTGGEDPGKMTYFLILSSNLQTPYLKTDFDVVPVFNSPGCIDQTKGYYGFKTNDPANMDCPTTSFYPFPLRHIGSAQEGQEGVSIQFKDTSVRFGYPLWQESGSPIHHQILDTHADPIREWNWDFSADPYAVEFIWDYWPYPATCNSCPQDPRLPYGDPETYYPQPYAGTPDPMPPEDMWPYNQQVTTPFGPLEPLRDPENHDRAHTYMAPGIFPACLSTHTEDQDLIDSGTTYKAHWRQSDPPFSDRFPAPVGGDGSVTAGFYTWPIAPSPPNKPIMHIRPRPDTTWPMHGDTNNMQQFRGGGMFCKPVTIFNAPPIASISWEQNNDNSLVYRFRSTSVDPDWQCPVTVDEESGIRICDGNLTHPRPFWNSYGAPICGDCPPDGIFVRQWDFLNDGFVPHTNSQLGYGGRCMPSVPAPNCNTYTTPQGDKSWRFLNRTITDAFTWDPTFKGTCPESTPTGSWFCSWNWVCDTNPTPGQKCTTRAKGRLPNGCDFAKTPPDDPAVKCTDVRADIKKVLTELGWAECRCNYTRILHSEKGSFRADDVGAKVSGYGVPEGTVITEYLDNMNVLVNQDLPPSYFSMATCSTFIDPTDPCESRILHPKARKPDGTWAVPPAYAAPFHKNVYPLTVSISWPYDPEVDDPTFKYPVPGNYALKHTVCDRDYLVHKTGGAPINPTMYPAQNTPGAPTTQTPLGNWGGMGRVLGDPMDLVEVTVSGAGALVPPWQPSTGTPKTVNLWSSDVWPSSATKAVRSQHACASEVKTLSIQNHAPHISVPPHFAVRLGGYATFVARGWDVDEGQVLTLRLCPTDPLAVSRTLNDGVFVRNSTSLTSVTAGFTSMDVGRLIIGPVPAGTTIAAVLGPNSVRLSAGATQGGTGFTFTVSQHIFPTISTLGPGKSIEQTFKWNMAGLPVGLYGPVCFEVTDGIQTTRMLTTIYVAAEKTDTDGDGVVDLSDNCPGVPNADQVDTNLDGVGDACQDLVKEFDATPPTLVKLAPGESDVDLDGIADVRDNCVEMANRDQSDDDGDQSGDICDGDADGDAIPNNADNCPLWPNPRQEDANLDNVGDICIGPSPRKLGADPSSIGQGERVKAQDSTWTLVLGSLLGVVVMIGVLVPLLLFALRRHQAKK